MDSFTQNTVNNEGDTAPVPLDQSTWEPQVDPYSGQVNVVAAADGSHHYRPYPPAGQIPVVGQVVGQYGRGNHQPFGQLPHGQHHANQPVNNNASLRPQHPNAATSAYPPRGFPPQGNRRPILPGAATIDPNFVFSPNYQGSRHAPDNHSVNISPEQNCSVFIRCLPPNCTPQMLLQKIRGCGSKVYALFINAPDQQNPLHCAAKLVFFQRCGVDWLFNKIRAGRFSMFENGRLYQPNACANKIRAAPLALEDERSRVVIVAGPPTVVNSNTLIDLFQRHFYFEIDCIYDHHATADWSVMQIHFSSTRCQSENAVQVFRVQTARPASSFAPLGGICRGLGQGRVCLWGGPLQIRSTKEKVPGCLEKNDR
ncbi:hypothetical protein PG987_002174 [Apiospora arundinis]